MRHPVMNIVNFKITDSQREAEGIVELAKLMRVTCLMGERFLVAESGLAVLDQLGIRYIVLAREPCNYVRHSISMLTTQSRRL